MSEVIQKFKVGDLVTPTEKCRKHCKIECSFPDKVIKVHKLEECLKCSSYDISSHSYRDSACSCPKTLTGYIIELENGKRYNQDWLYKIKQ